MSDLFLEQVLVQLRSGQLYPHLPMHGDKSCVLMALEASLHDEACYIVQKLADVIDKKTIEHEDWMALALPPLQRKILSLGIHSNRPFEDIIEAIIANNHLWLHQILQEKIFTQENLDIYLHFCCQKNAYDCIGELLSKGANIESKGITGNTALLSAIEHDNEIVARYLLSYHPDLAATNHQDYDALELALMHDMNYLSQDIIPYSNINHLPYLGENALMIASAKGNDAIVELLLVYGAEPNTKNHRDKTALDFANIHPHVAHVLLEHGARCDNLALHLKHSLVNFKEKILRQL